MEEFSADAQKGKIGYLLTLVVIAAGSAAVLAPAWLPGKQLLPSEGSLAEILQMLLLAVSAALFFGASYHVGRMKPIYFGFGLGGVAAVLGELGQDVNELIAPLSTDLLLVPVFLWIAWCFVRHPKEFSRFWGLASKRPATGFLVAAVIITYVFAEIFASKAFWKASLGEQFDARIPRIVESYLELLATYFIFVAAVGFTLPVTKRAKLKKAK